MNPSILTVNNIVATMTSLELLDLINQQRTEFGEVEVRRNQFHDRVRDELEGEDYQSFVVANPNGTQSEAFHLSLDQCVLVAMRESKGVRRQVQAKLRDAQVPVIDLNNPEHLRGLLGSYAEKAIELKSQLAIAAPKATALDRIALSDGSLCLTDAAKTLQLQPRKLTQLLQEKGWLYRRPTGAGWLAYQDRIQQGVLEHKTTTGEKGDGSEWTGTQVRVTAKGLAKLAVVIGEVTA